MMTKYQNNFSMNSNTHKELVNQTLMNIQSVLKAKFGILNSIQEENSRSIVLKPYEKKRKKQIKKNKTSKSSSIIKKLIR